MKNKKSPKRKPKLIPKIDRTSKDYSLGNLVDQTAQLIRHHLKESESKSKKRTFSLTAPDNSLGITNITQQVALMLRKEAHIQTAKKRKKK